MWITISDQLHHFFQSLSLVGHCVSYSAHAETKKCVVVSLPYLPVVNPLDILQKWFIKREFANKDESAAKKSDNGGGEIWIKY